jgi:hypothetical protein
VVQLAVMQEAVIIESLSDGRYAGGYDLVGWDDEALGVTHLSL